MYTSFAKAAGFVGLAAIILFMANSLVQGPSLLKSFVQYAQTAAIVLCLILIGLATHLQRKAVMSQSAEGLRVAKLFRQLIWTGVALFGLAVCWVLLAILLFTKVFLLTEFGALLCFVIPSCLTMVSLGLTAYAFVTRWRFLWQVGRRGSDS